MFPETVSRVYYLDVKASSVKQTATAIQKGGGVASKVLVRGPRQARWMKLLERVDRREVELAVRGLARKAKGNVANVAGYLGVETAFLKRYGLETVVTDDDKFAPLPRYRTPSTVAEVLPIIGALGGVGSGRGGGGSGAWRIVDLLGDKNPQTRAAALEAFRISIEPCQSIGEVSQVFGVTRMLLWKWRARFPKLDAIVREKEGVGRRHGVKNKVDGRRRLSIEEAVELMRPYLPGTATEVSEKISANRAGPHGIVLSPRELSFYIGKPTSDGLMVARWPSRQNGTVVKTLTLVDTNDGKRLDPRPPRGAHHCTLCGGVGHNRVKCPDNVKGRSDAEKKTGPEPPRRVGRSRERARASSPSNSPSR